MKSDSIAIRYFSRGASRRSANDDEEEIRNLDFGLSVYLSRGMVFTLNRGMVGESSVAVWVVNAASKKMYSVRIMNNKLFYQAFPLFSFSSNDNAPGPLIMSMTSPDMMEMVCKNSYLMTSLSNAAYTCLELSMNQNCLDVRVAMV